MLSAMVFHRSLLLYIGRDVGKDANTVTLIRESC